MSRTLDDRERQRATPGPSAEQAGEELEWLLERTRSLVSVVRASERQARAAAARAEDEDGPRRIEALEEEVRALELRLASAEQHNERLMRLYVATYQLHATLNPSEVLEAISEIVVNLVGADRFVLLLTDPPSGRAAIVLGHGLDEEVADRSLIRFAGRQYPGGDPTVDATLKDGRLRTGGPGGLAAVVPLNVSGRTVGALVLLRLLDHRRELGAEDREMLDLLAAHVACALFAAQSYANADRKLRTLAGILEPARRTA
jgi:nitrate/nitrite-specific signal transduction histidine kinase